MHAPVARKHRRASSPWSVLWRFAWRNLQGGLSGFRVFIACIALGVAALSGVSSLSNALTDGLGQQAKTILGGDLAFSRIHREATPEERAKFEKLGPTSFSITTRAMARLPQDGQAALVEVKAVNGAWPLVGAPELSPDLPLPDLFAPGNQVWGAAAEPALFERLQIKPGARVMIGDATFELRAMLNGEPDKLATGIGFGPRFLTSEEALRATGLLQPGTLARFTYRILLPDNPSEETARSIGDALSATMPEGEFNMRTRSNVSPQFNRNVERFTQFLAIVGFTALIVGGVGVANAVSAYVERRRPTLATMKSLGATGSDVFILALMEVMVLALIGIAIGLAIGAALPFVVGALFGDLLPVALDAHLYPGTLLLGGIYGLLAALVFSLGPLGRVHDVPVSALFRDHVELGRRWPRKRYIAALLLAAALLIGLSIIFAYDRRVAIFAALGVGGSFIILRLVATAIMAAARAMPRPKSTVWRLAISSLHRPGTLTPSLVLSLGLGVALLVAIALIDANINRQLGDSLPEKAPSLFFVDIPSANTADFDAFIQARAPEGKLDRVPMMRGRITRVNGEDASKISAPENAAWVLEGDRGITYSAQPPSGSTVVAGEWWPANYQGKPLVSFDAELARSLKLKVGDTITVNVLGRPIEATIANLRRIDWQSLGINFVMVFSPNTFAGAPATSLATLTLPEGSRSHEAGLLAEVAKNFPMVTAIGVREALEQVNSLVSKLALAIRGASAVTIIASVLVLAGALGAGQRARIGDAVILKTLGATRLKLFGAFLLEYGLLGAVTALFGFLAGSLAAWAIVTRLMNLGFHWLVGSALSACIIAIAVTILFGLIGTWRILSQKPASYLRNL